jgi:hypothetical protein
MTDGEEEVEETEMYLTSHATLQQHRRVLVDELQLLQNVDSLLVVREKLEVLLAESHAEAVAVEEG